MLKSGCFREFSGFSRKILCISSDCDYSPFLTLLLVFWNNDKRCREFYHNQIERISIFFQSKVQSFPFLVEQRVESMITLQKNDSTRLDKKKKDGWNLTRSQVLSWKIKLLKKKNLLCRFKLFHSEKFRSC